MKFLNTTTILFFLLCLVQGTGALGVGPEEVCGFSRLASEQQKAVVLGWGQARERGAFEAASEQDLSRVEAKYLADKARPEGLKTTVDGKIERLKQEHLDVDLNGQTPQKLQALRQSGLTHLSESTPAEGANEFLAGTPYENFSSLLYYTSGAGLWSRGGGTVKALLPLNIKELITPAEAERLVAAGKIVAAKSPEDVAKLSGLESTPSAEQMAEIRNQAVDTIAQLTGAAMEKPEATNVLDLKIANVAMLSRKTKSYVHFDIWTSEQTHEPIRQYLEKLKGSYQKKVFHPDPKINAEVRQAVGDYLAASEKLGETMLFGYQEGFYPLDPKTGKSQRDKPAIGEGAGMAKHYMDKSGRTALLAERGVRDCVFQNIEVSSDTALEYGAYRQAGKDVGAVMVPTQDGYAGGSPYRVVSEDGTVRKQLLEGSAVDKSLQDGNDYFNSNTIYQSLSLNPPQNVGYEAKDNGMSIRLKMNAGDVTFEEESAMIGGRVQDEYENFKSYGDYLNNGQDTIERMQALWGN